MDWFDEYLNALSDGRNAVFPPDSHTWGVKPAPNAQQKRMIFDAAAQSETEFRQLVAEARREEERQGMGPSVGIGADPGSPTRQTADTGAWLTRKVYTEFLGGYGIPNPTYTELSDAIAGWTPTLIDIPTTYVWADLPLGTWEFTGYFVAPEAGLYSFSSSVDDYTFISFGDPVPINNVGHITLQAGEAVPLRIFAANVAGPGLLTLLWKNNASQTSYTSNFNGLVYTTLPAGVPVAPNCTDATAGVLMTGANAIWPYGPRLLSPIGYAPYGLETYQYNAEVVRYDGSAWIYENNEGIGEIARSYSPVAWPWLATWPDFIASKVCLT